MAKKKLKHTQGNKTKKQFDENTHFIDKTNNKDINDVEYTSKDIIISTKSHQLENSGEDTSINSKANRIDKEIENHVNDKNNSKVNNLEAEESIRNEKNEKVVNKTKSKKGNSSRNTSPQRDTSSHDWKGIITYKNKAYDKDPIYSYQGTTKYSGHPNSNINSEPIISKNARRHSNAKNANIGSAEYDYDFSDSLDNDISQPDTYNDDNMDNFTLKHPSKLRILSILISIIVLLGLIMLVIIVLIVAIFRYFNNRTQSIYLNIHLKIEECEPVATNINRNVALFDPDQKIDLKDYQQPHITLYLTQFEASHYNTIEKEVDLILASHLSNFSNCEVNFLASSMKNLTTYAMWPVEISDCIQGMSDIIVEKLSSYITFEARNQIPDWVNELPHPLKDQKINMIKKYGSPNVFKLFDPHVTLAYDSNPKRLQEAFDKNPGIVKTCIFKASTIAFGSVGEYGTVIRGKDYQTFSLNK